MSNDTDIIYAVWWEDEDYREDSQSEYLGYFKTYALAEQFIIKKLGKTPFTREDDMFIFKIKHSYGVEEQFYNIEAIKLVIK